MDCWLLNENSRQAMNSSKSVSPSDMSSKIQPRSPSLLFHKLIPRVPLSEVHLPPTNARTSDSTKSATSALIPPLPSPVPEKPRGSGGEDESLNILRASPESLHGHQVTRKLPLFPTTCCRDDEQCFGLQHYLAETFPSRPDRLFRPVVGVRQLSHPVG